MYDMMLGYHAYMSLHRGWICVLHWRRREVKTSWMVHACRLAIEADTGGFKGFIDVRDLCSENMG